VARVPGSTEIQPPFVRPDSSTTACAQRHHQNVSLVRAVIGHDAPGFRVDRGDGLLAEPDVGHREVAVGKANGLRRPLAEHDVQLREAEHEGVRAIDQGDVDLVTQLAREAGRELEAAEAGPEHEHGRGHGRDG